MKFNKHIVFFSPGFPADEQDGSCLPAVQNFVRCFGEQFPGWEVTVLSLHYPFESGNYHWHGIQVIALGGKNRSYPSRLLLWRKALSTLKRVHKNKTIDLLHSFWMHECAMIGSYFSRKAKIPLAVTLMGQDLRPPNHFVRLIRQSKTTLVALSNYQPERKKTGIRKPDAVIPFGIPKWEKEWLAPAEKKVDVIGVGSLITLKNYKLFLEVIYRLKTKRPDVKALIIGDGVNRKDVESRIFELQLQGNVTLPGELPRKEIYQWLGRSKAFLHTSTYETQGYVFNEALLANVPIVSTAMGIAREEEYWKLGANADELAIKVDQFLKRPVSIPPEAKWSMENTVEGYADLYMRSFKSSATSAAIKK